MLRGVFWTRLAVQPLVDRAETGSSEQADKDSALLVLSQISSGITSSDDPDIAGRKLASPVTF